MQMGRSNVVNLVFIRVIVDELDAGDFYGVVLNGIVAVADKCCSLGSDLVLFVTFVFEWTHSSTLQEGVSVCA